MRCEVVHGLEAIGSFGSSGARARLTAVGCGPDTPIAAEDATEDIAAVEPTVLSWPVGREAVRQLHRVSRPPLGELRHEAADAILTYRPPLADPQGPAIVFADQMDRFTGYSGKTYGPFQVVAADMEMDGDVDLFINWHHLERSKVDRFFIFTPGSDGIRYQLSEPGTIPPDYGRGRQVQWVDIDNDAQNELYVGNEYSGNVLLAWDGQAWRDRAGELDLNFAITFGEESDTDLTHLVEVTAGGDVVWDVTLPVKWGSYRAERVVDPPFGYVIDE